MEDLELRSLIYRHIADTGVAPNRGALIELLGSASEADAQLRRLHDGHAIVLDDRPERLGEIRMALPFSAIPTEFVVTADDGQWWANCAWDSLAIGAATGRDIRIESNWVDTGEPVDLDVVDGRLSHGDGYVHFQVPAHKWWDDIVRT